MTTTHITQTTHCFTLQQLRAATQAGGVAGVSLKGHGNGFFIQIQLRTGQQAVLVTARSQAPRMFKGATQAFGVLRRIGIVTGSFDVTHYVPEQQQTDAEQATQKPAKKAKAKKIAAKKAAKKPAKKIATLAPVSTEEANTTTENNQQASFDDPHLQANEEKPVAVQQSLI